MFLQITCFTIPGISGGLIQWFQRPRSEQPAEKHWYCGPRFHATALIVGGRDAFTVPNDSVPVR